MTEIGKVKFIMSTPHAHPYRGTWMRVDETTAPKNEQKSSRRDPDLEKVAFESNYTKRVF